MNWAGFILLLIVFHVKAKDIIQIDAVVGHIAELPCNITAENEGDTFNILAWYRNGSSTAFYSRDMRSEDEAGEVTSVDGPGGRYRLVASDEDGLNTLQILSVRPSDAGPYHCFVDFVESPARKTFSELHVIEPPQRVWVIHENGTRVATANAGSNTSQNIGPYYVGDTVHLVCVAFGGKPLASLLWLVEQRLVKGTVTPLSEHRVRSDLQRGPLRREDHGTIYSCVANNNNKTQPISVDVIINMRLPPLLVSVRDISEGVDTTIVGGRVNAGDILKLQCRVLGARPTPAILWQLDGRVLEDLHQNTTHDISQRLVVSEVQLLVKREHDETHVTCCAPSNMRSGPEYICAKALPLTVSYEPALEVVSDGDLENNTLTVLKGSNVTLNCSCQANPPVYQMSWFHENDTKSTDDKNPVQPVLELRNVTESDGGEYACTASNDFGTSYSEPITIDVIYPPYCKDESIAEYGLGENEFIDVTCKVTGNPEPTSYRWVMVDEAVNATTFRNTQPHSTMETENATFLYQKPSGTTYTTIFCWGVNGVIEEDLPYTSCTFLITDETVPWPPKDCVALKTALGDITVTCEKGHDGGLPQKFHFIVQSLDSDKQILSIVNLEPKFIIEEPKEENFKFIVVATNEKGDSKIVEIDKDSIVNLMEDRPKSAFPNIATLTLALCAGVALVALAACGLVLCAHERGSRLDLPRAVSDPPLCAYNTEESNCETYHDSDDNSECNVRRTESFRRAMSKYPSKNFDVQRTGSFHSARYMNDIADPEGITKYSDGFRHSNHCRVHSLQNISRKRELDALCDHLVMHLPPDPNYHVPKPMNTFYTMPRKTRNKMAKQIRDDTSEITQTSDGFSLPPPPDEFGTYRAGTRIKDMPSKPTPTHTTIVRKNSAKESKQKYNDVIISPMNTVGLPTVSGGQSSIYTYPDDEHQGMPRTTGVLTTFQSFSSPSESGI